MLYTLAGVIVFSAVLIFFSQELIGFIKKIMSIKGAKLVLPLFFISWVVYSFELWILWVLLGYQKYLNIICLFLEQINPYKSVAQPVAVIVILTVISVLPVYILDKIVQKRVYHRYKYPYITSAIIWIITAILFIVLGTPQVS